ncbi:hypothetical protein [Pseudomonas sp. TB1-B1]|uniref:hypothetical protein n=1 Tax=Pseudomonas sp. TB1-B1 TaxID=2985515 RepID=UPI00226E07AC|nr:hypothetical protein [Pseudomonas sp. TB1-B1]MCX9150172.1 hypothetical protein [Pseudomonas sp. TB1-B1]
MTVCDGSERVWDEMQAGKEGLISHTDGAVGKIGDSLHLETPAASLGLGRPSQGWRKRVPQGTAALRQQIIGQNNYFYIFQIDEDAAQVLSRPKKCHLGRIDALNAHV